MSILSHIIIWACMVLALWLSWAVCGLASRGPDKIDPSHGRRARRRK
jgi:hypothetical protein